MCRHHLAVTTIMIKTGKVTPAVLQLPKQIVGVQPANDVYHQFLKSQISQVSHRKVVFDIKISIGEVRTALLTPNQHLAVAKPVTPAAFATPNSIGTAIPVLALTGIQHVAVKPVNSVLTQQLLESVPKNLLMMRRKSTALAEYGLIQVTTTKIQYKMPNFSN